MKVLSKNETGKSNIVCEHCGNETAAFHPVKDELLALAFCGECRRNSAGDRSAFDMEEFLKTGGA